MENEKVNEIGQDEIQADDILLEEKKEEYKEQKEPTAVGSDESDDDFEKIEPGVWKPEVKGDSITGILINVTPREGDISSRYMLEHKDGMTMVWGSAVLEDRMQYVKVGQKVRITFEGKEKNKNNRDVKLFKVEIAKSS